MEQSLKFESRDLLLPLSQERNNFALFSFEKDGQTVSLPVRVFSFSDRPNEVSVWYREEGGPEWLLLESSVVFPGKVLLPKGQLSPRGEILLFNNGNNSVHFKVPVQILIPRGRTAWQSVSLGENTALPPGYAAMIRLSDIADLKSNVTIHFASGDLLIAWGMYSYLHDYRYVSGAAGVLLLAGGIIVVQLAKKKRAV